MDLINKSIPFLVSCSNGCVAKVEEQGNQRLPESSNILKHSHPTAPGTFGPG
jgi:hypothetical protein